MSTLPQACVVPQVERLGQVAAEIAISQLGSQIGKSTHMNRLMGKHILITGASRGLGRQLAIDFAGEGATAISITARRTEDLAEVRDRILEASPATRVALIAANLATQDDIERIVAATLSEFSGRLDVLVNNASVLGPTPMPFLLDYPLEDFRDVININLIAPFLLIKKALPAMIEAGGSIINVTSDAGHIGYPGWGAYGISKFGIEGMSETWAAELDESDVRVNWVDPGDMNTQMHRDAEPDENPSQWADPEEVTEVFIYLASDESKGVTGKRFQAQEENWGLKELEASDCNHKEQN
jgi:NAD(P)-dependent dehydrogenase (short-subunit alcohol dehydrogenase family)